MDAGIAAIDLDLAAVPKATISVETDRSNDSPRRSRASSSFHSLSVAPSIRSSTVARGKLARW
jgi:hypothetical protein